MKKFRKKPLIVEAVQFNPHGGTWPAPDERTSDFPEEVRRTTYGEVVQLLGTAGCSKERPFWSWHVLGIVQTLEGPAVALPGDWIVKGTKGEMYPVRKEIFEEIYEVVDG